MVARKGYKLTELGEIPEDWEIVQLDDIAKVTSGKRLPSGFFVTKYETPHPYIRVSDMQPGNVSTENIMYVPINAAEHIKQYRIYKGDLFISVAGTLGIVGKIPPELDGANLTENADRITEIRCDKGFLLYILLSPHTQSVIDSIRTVGAQPKLALGRIRKFDIPLPPTEKEQNAIATALSDADALIDALEQSIAKKRQIKQGAMQELLTGKRRLPGFAGEWSVKQLGDVGQIKSGGTPSTLRADFWDGEIPWCTPSDLTNLTCSKLLTQTSRSISQYGLKFSSAEIIPKRSLIMTTRATIGECAINSVPMTTNQGFKNIVPFADVNVDFLYYLMSTQKNRLVSLCGGSTFLEMGKTQLLSFEILMPDYNEQTAIAAVLSDMDDEITALEAKLAKARQIKIGMMQELLTGRIRLV